MSLEPTSHMDRTNDDQPDQEDVKRFRETIKILESFDDQTWSLIDQAIDTSKVAHGPNPTPGSVSRLIDDAVRPKPEGWYSALLAAIISDPDEVRSMLGETTLDAIEERLNYLISRHQIWLRYVIHRSGTLSLDWRSINSDYVNLNEEVDLLRLIVERRDGSTFTLEMPPDSAVRLATRILRVLVRDLPEGSIKVDDDDMRKLTEAVSNVTTTVAKNTEQ